MDWTLEGKVITVQGPVETDKLGAVMMHEHLHINTYDWENKRIPSEVPMSDEKRDHFMKEIFPYIKKLNNHGCFCIVDASFAPERAPKKRQAFILQRTP